MTIDQRHNSIEERIGYAFQDRSRIDRALTHSSRDGGEGSNYERLEFLGDRVLGLCVAELLFSTFKDSDEGDLSVRLNLLVSGEACAQVADELGLHEFIMTGSDIKNITAKRMASVRADVVESLIAAIYLDGGLEAARNFVMTNWKERALNASKPRRDAKTELQEWAHQNHGATPAYRVMDRSGPDHEPRFTVEVSVPGMASETGISRSKRGAEQLAAEALLRREAVWN